MRLREVLAGVALESLVAEIEISSVENDSRSCTPGALFFAVPGGVDDGARFIEDAINNGAAAVVSTVATPSAVPIITVGVSDIRPLLSRASATVATHPESALRLVGVTGTNGKTSVTTFLADLLTQVGVAATTMGTLTQARTTPAPPELFRTLQSIRDQFSPSEPVPVVAMEVSSHALDQGRVDGLTFSVAVFTNLSHDHLDYHQTMDAYFEAKAMLFTPARAEQGVVWCDDEWSQELVRRSNIPLTVVTPADLGEVRTEVGALSFEWRGARVATKLTGSVNAVNLTLALEAAACLGVPVAHLREAAPNVRPVRGRYETVADAQRHVLIDYAHTPDGLEHLLRDLSESVVGRTVMVFGCGGDRDQAKRPLMGEVAARLADLVVVTSDNPRSEDPSEIVSQVLAGIPRREGIFVELDRRKAIAMALSLANKDDLVVIAGKGHETTQTINDETRPFDDAAVVRELLKEIGEC